MVISCRHERHVVASRHVWCHTFYCRHLTLLREHLAGLLSVPRQLSTLSVQMEQALALLEQTTHRQSATEQQVARIDARTQRLSPAQTRTVQELVDRVVRETRHLVVPLTHIVLYGRLKQRCRVGSFKEVPDARYEEVLAFLSEELRRATSGQVPEQGSLF